MDRRFTDIKTPDKSRTGMFSAHVSESRYKQTPGWYLSFKTDFMVFIVQSISHWGNTFATGRGLLALAGRGQIFEMSLNKGDEYVVHPRCAFMFIKLDPLAGLDILD